MFWKKDNNDSSPAPAPPTLGEVQLLIDQIHERKASLTAELERVQTESNVERQNLGEGYLAGDDGGIRRLSELEGRATAINAALSLLDSRRSLLDVALKAATAAYKRESAARKTVELEKLRASTAELIAKLSEIEGIPYDRSILQAMRVGGFYKANGTGSADEFDAPDDVFPEPAGANAGAYLKPNSKRLQEEIANLIVEAEQLEQEVTAANALPRNDAPDVQTPPQIREPTLYGQNVKPIPLLKGGIIRDGVFSLEDDLA